MAAALALQARLALGQAEKEQAAEEGPADAAAARRLVLEARWAAAGSLRELQQLQRGGCAPAAAAAAGRGGKGGEHGEARGAALAQLLLGQAELAAGKTERGVEALLKVRRPGCYPSASWLTA